MTAPTAQSDTLQKVLATLANTATIEPAVLALVTSLITLFKNADPNATVGSLLTDWQTQLDSTDANARARLTELGIALPPAKPAAA